ncbi:MAG: C45 family autoproteolytic acyltransferase/hydrolase [Aureispira sp.]
MTTLEINLDLPPQERWHFAAQYTQEINEIIACYWVDIEDYLELIEVYLEDYKTVFISKDFWEEIKGLAKYCAYTADQILIANLYYDIVKFAFACTAFAVEVNGHIYHARNLDWWTENDVLKTHTKIFKFTRAGKTIFQSVGWIGFVGVLSGMKPNAFSVTLNAIVSDEVPNMGKPIAFLLREVLEGTYTFQQAKTILEETTLIGDCLLLLAGVKREELCVIERTPTQKVTRTTQETFILVTNDYKGMVQDSKNQSALKETSCGRYEQTKFLLEQRTPSGAKACFDVLSDKDVKMTITVQQMVFNTSLGLVECRAGRVELL